MAGAPIPQCPVVVSPTPEPADFGEPLALIWAEDPLEAPLADGDPVASWRNAGSLGGDFVSLGGAGVTYETTDFVRPSFKFDGTTLLDLSPPASSSTGPFTLVTVHANPNGTEGPILAAYDVPPDSGVATFASPPQDPTTHSIRFFGHPMNVGAFQTAAIAPGSILTTEGRGVDGSPESVSINGGAFAVGDVVPVGLTIDSIQVGGHSVFGTFNTGWIFFAAIYPAPTAPAGLIDNLKAHYSI